MYSPQTKFLVPYSYNYLTFFMRHVFQQRLVFWPTELN
jgi:hypothetical protein